MASLGNDLAVLRKRRDFSIEDVHEITKIPAQIIRSIENDSIQDRMDMNTTYVRNYIRSYARAIGIDESKIVKALNKVQQNNYNGELLGEDKPSPNPADDDISDDDSVDNSQQEERTESAQDDKAGRGERNAASSPQNRSQEEWDWVEVGRNAPPRSSSQRKTFSMIILLIILLAAAFLTYYFLYHAGASPNSQTTMNNIEQPAAPQSNASPDTPNGNQAANDSTMRQSGQAFASLPDTLTLTVYAVNGKLNPIRIYTDLTGKYNPYWVKQGDSLQVRFTDTVRVQAVNQYNHLQLQFRGRLIPNAHEKYYDKEAKAIKLTRSIFKNL